MVWLAGLVLVYRKFFYFLVGKSLSIVSLLQELFPSNETTHDSIPSNFQECEHHTLYSVLQLQITSRQ